MIQNKFIFGITGGTGAGKTTVCDEFRNLGIYVCDCDKIAHSIINTVPCRSELTDEFGDMILNADGSVNRKILGGIVFTDRDKLGALNKITHKYIKRAVIEEIENCKGEMAGVDGAVLIGSGIEDILDCMVSVIADEETRLLRIMERDGISREDANKRICSQKNNEFYLANSDYIIYNNGEDIKNRVKELRAIFMKKM